MDKIANKLLAMDRLVYQTDTCRIFHFANDTQDKAIRDTMTDFPNQSIWILKHECYEESADPFKINGYLIYHTR